MNNAIQKREQTSLNVFGNVRDFETAQRIAKALAHSTIVPKQYQQNEPNCLIALEVSSRLNFSPLSVMQNMYIVHGRPAFEAKFVIATINSCGRFTPLRFRFDGEGTEYGCRAVCTDIATGEDLSGTKITRRMVDAEGWSSNSKWKSMEEQMFKYRAASFWQREFAPELTMGMMSREEVEDINVIDTPSEDIIAEPAQVKSDDPLEKLRNEAQAQKAGAEETPVKEAPAKEPAKSQENIVTELRQEVIDIGNELWGDDSCMIELGKFCRKNKRDSVLSADRNTLDWLRSELLTRLEAK